MTPFDTFWTIYPRRVAKLDAMKAFDKALKIAPAEDILAGARRYAAIQREPQFTKHPATWLRGGGWMDEEAAPALASGVAGQRERLRQEIEYEHGQGQAHQDSGRTGWLLEFDREGPHRPH